MLDYNDEFWDMLMDSNEALHYRSDRTQMIALVRFLKDEVTQ